MSQLSHPTKYCKICFKEINDYSFYNFSHAQNIICEKCFSSLKAKFKCFEIGTVKAIAVYDYDETIRKLIYQFKGCYDYELKDVFLFRYITFLKLKFYGYIMVPAPSSKVDDKKRGFNHVIEIYKSLGLEMAEVIKKTNKEKQSDKTSKERLKVNKILTGQNLEKIRGKKVLLVDDIYTTGSTIFRMIEIVKTVKPKDIKVLVIAKTIDLDKRENNNIP